MESIDSILEATRDTPLVRIQKLVDPKTMANVYGKAEFLLPSGSVKDRMALHIVECAEKSGQLKPGGTIVEATAGNTGLALAMVAAVKGYRTVFVMPDKFSVEKINMLKGFGSEVIITPTAVPDDHPESWTNVAKRIVKETPNSILINQFFNLDNVEAHYQITGPEIWRQTGGEIDALVLGAGSGGTISGAGKYLKEKAAEAGKEIKLVLVDPVGSFYHPTFYGEPVTAKTPWRMEGVGNDFIPDCLDLSIIDEVRKVNDKQAYATARRIAREEGMLVGDTSGANLYVAIKVAKELGPGKNVVTFLADSGNRYISKLYNDDWMREHGFALQGLGLWQATVEDILNFKGTSVEFAQGAETIATVAERMDKLGISQLPLATEEGKPHRMIHESDLLHGLLRNEHKADDTVESAAKALEGQVSPDDDISLLEPLFDNNNVAVVVNQSNELIGIISKIDVVKYLASTAG